MVGSLQATVPAAQAGAVPWLLLAAKSHAGDGALTRVTHIQRLDTMGGKAPAGGASAAHAGEKVRIPYTAAYYFYGPQ